MAHIARAGFGYPIGSFLPSLPLDSFYQIAKVVPKARHVERLDPCAANVIFRHSPRLGDATVK